jgi:hypothetical protein
MFAIVAPHNIGSSNGLEYYKHMELLMGPFCAIENNNTAVDGCKQAKFLFRA